MTQETSGKILIGIGGWTYEPWRGTFYPEKHPQKQELAYASRHLTSIEVNGTFYGAQKPETFAKWHDETPDGFIFSLKAPRFATNRRILADAGPTIERFLTGGLLELKKKLGPINWQFMSTKKFNPTDFEAFLNLLPKSVGGHVLRHVVEVRHESFQTPDFIHMAKEHGVAVVLDADSKYPQIADPTAPFIYARIMGTREDEPLGYPPEELDIWSRRIKSWASGKLPDDLHYSDNIPPETQPRDVYLYVISGFKERNPAAAMSLLGRVT